MSYNHPPPPPLPPARELFRPKQGETPVPPVPMVSPLPGVLRGVREVAEVLKWPHEFIRTWMDAPAGGTVPRLPWYAAGDSQVFLTVECLEWLAKHWPGGPGVERERGGQPGGGRKVFQ